MRTPDVQVCQQCIVSRVRVWIREQRKIKRRSKALLSLRWQTWTSLYSCIELVLCETQISVILPGS